MQTAGQITKPNLDLSTNQTSAPIYLEQRFLAQITSVMTGSPAGTLTYQFSNDYQTNMQPSNFTPTNWYVWDPTNATFTVSGAGTQTLNLWYGCPFWMRLVWTASGGSTGTLTTIQFGGKGG